MTKALRVRIESNGQYNGTEVYDTKDGAKLGNVIAARFEYRINHTPIVVLELMGGEILLTDAALGLAESAPTTTGEVPA